MTAGEQQTGCPQCGSRFPASVRICPHDGTVLEHPTMTSAPAGVILDGKYRLDSLLAEGGMGSVYKATHVMLGKTVAIKLIKAGIVTSPEIVRRFQREARAATALNHPNIVSVYDLGQTADGTLYIAMEFIEGTSLKSVIKAGHGIPALRTVAILRQVASALSVAHRASIIHRDLKPQNIMLTKGHDGAELAKLVDFGIAKTFEEGTELTMAGHALGTPYYMSPEQIEGRPVDARSDLYALGIIVYEMLVGEVPFADQSTPAVLIKQLRERPAPPSIKNPGVPPMLEDIALRCLEKDPALRFQTVDEFVVALGQAAESLTATELAPTLPMHARSSTTQTGDEATLPMQSASKSSVVSPEPAAVPPTMAAVSADKGTRPTTPGIPPPVPLPASAKRPMAPLIAILLLFGGLAMGAYFWWARQQAAAVTPPQTVQAEPPDSVPAIASQPAPVAPQQSSPGAPDTTSKIPQPGVPNPEQPPAVVNARPRPSTAERMPPSTKSVPAPTERPSGQTAAVSPPAGAGGRASTQAPADVAPPPRPEPAGIPENAAVYFGCSGAPDVCAALRSAVSNAFEKGGLRSVNAPARADIAIEATTAALQDKVDRQFDTTFATRTYSIELTGDAPRAGDDVAMPGASTVSFDASLGRDRLDEKARVIASDIVDRVRAYVKKKRGQ
jgi:eukaryotic-like serine/threonine-protein kinase